MTDALRQALRAMEPFAAVDVADHRPAACEVVAAALQHMGTRTGWQFYVPIRELVVQWMLDPLRGTRISDFRLDLSTLYGEPVGTHYAEGSHAGFELELIRGLTIDSPRAILGYTDHSMAVYARERKDAGEFLAWRTVSGWPSP